MRVETRAMPRQLSVNQRVNRWFWIKVFHFAGIHNAEDYIDYPEKLEGWFERRRLFLERDEHELE